MDNSLYLVPWWLWELWCFHVWIFALLKEYSLDKLMLCDQTVLLLKALWSWSPAVMSTPSQEKSGTSSFIDHWWEPLHKLLDVCQTSFLFLGGQKSLDRVSGLLQLEKMLFQSQTVLKCWTLTFICIAFFVPSDGKNQCYPDKSYLKKILVLFNLKAILLRSKLFVSIEHQMSSLSLSFLPSEHIELVYDL